MKPSARRLSRGSFGSVRSIAAERHNLSLAVARSCFGAYVTSQSCIT